MGRITVRRWLAVVIAGVFAAVAVAPAPALAHGGLATTSPPADSVVPAPTGTVSMTFTEKPAQFAYFTVTAPSGARVDDGWSHAEPVRLATPVTEYQLVDGTWQPVQYTAGFPVKITVAHWPGPGTYVVRYRTVASDGDQVQGDFRFSYTGTATPAPAGWQPPTDPPKAELLAAAGPAGPASAPAQAQAPAAAPADDTSRWVWLVPVLLVVAAGLCLLILRPPTFTRAR